jgi:hypothetical protein
MRRLSNALVVLCLAAALAVPAQAAPRRDDSGADGFLRNPIKKVVQIVKKLISAPLDLNDMSYPKP